jgi:hypothetical protein
VLISTILSKHRFSLIPKIYIRNNLARTTLDHDELVLAQSGALLRVGGRGAGLTGSEVVVTLVVGHYTIISM